ncbi:sigma-70 family RNA polymerase sigma factor [Limnobacter parvus]|uniref:Sigma-70 family RNA polymerase sigma factor n=1 Tax=Limnobacter parvus TaxID=2939690 RepID=A0ABT1XKM7_9BURK|nr:sigma-70 family RNA polymerase sigma factor [Limnobacter parvus]MCR2747847.1 sigma-70 family RNA polymerase sigma factor [Limnobacter parvus]
MHREASGTLQRHVLDIEFAHCYGQHADWLAAWFQRRLACNGAASELAQEVFLRLYEQRQQLPAIREPRAWLTAVAHGLLVNHYRRVDLEKAYLAALSSFPSDNTPGPEQKAVLFETLLELDQCLRDLPRKVRYAFLQAQLEGKKQQEIAGDLGVSLSMVKKYIAQAQKRCSGVEQAALNFSNLDARQRLMSSRALATMPRFSRRAVLKSLAVLFGSGGLFYGYHRSDYSADWTSAKGEIQTQILPDGSELTLDSDTAVDLTFTATQKLIVLRRGRVMINTASTSRTNDLKPMVRTREGFVQAMGTVFSVEQGAQSTLVEVFEDSVQWLPLASGDTHLLKAGEQAEFGRYGLISHQTVSGEKSAWVRGLYVASSVTLKEWAAEMNRYRTATLYCDKAVESWLVSGTFPLNQPEVALMALQDALPVQLIQHNTLAASGPVLLVARDQAE